jgi:hypothetical protein
MSSKNMKKLLFLAIPVFGLVPKLASAHCPLCTAGAGALAVLAASLGVSSVIVGILIGAFALALSIWLSSKVKKEYVPFQKQLLTLIIFLSTVVPIMPLVRDYGPLYVALGGEYGTLTHNTYTINLYVLGVIIGGIIMLIAPSLSNLVTRARGTQLPYQGMTITFSLLLIISAVVQLLS